MQNANYRLPVLPQDAPFEIRSSAGKGLGTFAIKDIVPTSRILVEEPLVVIYKPDYAISDIDVETAFSSLNSVEKQQFLNMGFSENRSFVSLYTTFIRNKFELRKAPDAEPDGEGMFLLCSRFNHSCVPNAAIVHDFPTSRTTYSQAIYAIKPIAKGDELTFNYDFNSYYQTTEIRRNVGNWEFICDCRACNVDDPFHYVSDMRRALLRGLYYLLNGVDAPGCEGRKVPVTREAEKEKLFGMKWSTLTFKNAEKAAQWNVVSGYLAEAEGIAIMASGNFKNAVFATMRLYDEYPVIEMQEVEMQKVYRNGAYRWATKSLDAIKSCRPADHIQVKDREQVFPLLSKFFLDCASSPFKFPS